MIITMFCTLLVSVNKCIYDSTSMSPHKILPSMRLKLTMLQSSVQVGLLSIQVKCKGPHQDVSKHNVTDILNLNIFYICQASLETVQSVHINWIYIPYKFGPVITPVLQSKIITKTSMSNGKQSFQVISSSCSWVLRVTNDVIFTASILLTFYISSYLYQGLSRKTTYSICRPVN